LKSYINKKMTYVEFEPGSFCKKVLKWRKN